MNISRRSLLAGAGALGACSMLPMPASANSGTIMGAIRWDAYYGSTWEGFAENALGMAPWQFRAPWFSKVTGPDTIISNGNVQANLDIELQAAHAAGIQYWAYDMYLDPVTAAPDNSGFMNAWKLHQSSAFKDSVKWAPIYQAPGGPTSTLAQMPLMVQYMSYSNYLTVLGGRPVFFWLVGPGYDATFAPAVTALRAAAASAGLQNPFVIPIFTVSGAAAVVTVDNWCKHQSAIRCREFAPLPEIVASCLQGNTQIFSCPILSAC